MPIAAWWFATVSQATLPDRQGEQVLVATRFPVQSEEQRGRKSARYRKTFERTLHQIDLARLLREMRDDAALTQAELAKKVGTTQSVIARPEDAEYAGHSLTMLWFRQLDLNWPLSPRRMVYLHHASIFFRTRLSTG